MCVDTEGPSALTPGSSRLRLRSGPARATTHGAARTPLQLPPTGGGAGLWLPSALLLWEEPCPAALPLWAACPAAPDFLSLISQEVTGRAGRGPERGPASCESAGPWTPWPEHGAPEGRLAAFSARRWGPWLLKTSPSPRASPFSPQHLEHWAQGAGPGPVHTAWPDAGERGQDWALRTVENTHAHTGTHTRMCMHTCAHRCVHACTHM